MEKSKRNMGIELLRIVAMFLIVCSHMLTQGGILNNVKVFSSQYYVAWTLMIVCYAAVNCFALISGYVGVGQKELRYAKIIHLWLNVLFYTLFITLAFSLFTEGKVGLMEWIKALTPASTGQYWFFSAYFILFFMMPFLNQLLNNISARQQLVLVLSLIFCFSILPTVRQTDAFVLNSGYSPLWLIVLYLLGGCIKKANLLEIIKLKWWIVILISSLSLCIISKFALEYISNRLLGEVRGGGILVSYLSPLMILIAVSMLAIFSKITIKSSFASKLTRLVSGSAFSVYIIHEHPLLKHEFLIDAFIPCLEFAPILLLLIVLGVAALIFILCTLIDWLRVGLFKVVKVNKFVDATVAFIGRGFKKLCKLITKGDKPSGDNDVL